MSEAIPILDENNQPRTTSAIMTDVNKQIETAVCRDPANWFWVHNRWKLKPTPPPVKTAAEAPSSTLTAPAGPTPQ